MSLITFLLALLAFLPAPAEALLAPAQYEALKGKAEESYTEKSFRRAHELYEQAGKLELPASERRWVEFRLADTTWRSEASSPSADPTVREGSRGALEELIRRSGNDHDRVWAEANESLGDFDASRPYARNYNAELQYWTAALDWWEGSDDLPLARKRYLDIIWRFSEAYRVPKELLVKALAIVESTKDRDRARLLLGRLLISEGKAESIERGLEHLDILIREGRKGAYYDEALFSYASQLANLGGVIVLDDGESGFRKDYRKALELYRRIVTEYQPGESHLYAQATMEIDQITRPSVGLLVGSTFLPSSEQQVLLGWRNVTSVELTLTAVDLIRDVQPGKVSRNNWLDYLQIEGRPAIRRWTFQTDDRGEYIPGTKSLRIAPRLGPGAYIITARNGEATSRQLLLVSDTGILTHNLNGHLSIVVADVVTGEPIAGAHVHVVHKGQVKDGFDSYDAETNASGVADVRINDYAYDQMLITASAGTRQAYETTFVYGGSPSSAGAEWRIYAFTDRAAFRPGETVHWKIIARTREGRDWTTPAGQKLRWEITSPRNETVASGLADLNAFGSFWAELPVTEAMPLGGYSIEFKHPSGKQEAVGSAQLFSIEEYKLPEFRVSVTTPEENGQKKQYRLGDTVEASIEATYYFGGPVANATVDVEIEESPYIHYWSPWHEYEWYYRDWEGGRYDGSDSPTRHETLKTDAHGRAVVHIETNRDGAATRYTLSAKVTDASRREVTGEGAVAVMKQRYSVASHPQHFLRLPNERVSVDFNAADANDQPVQTVGTVTVYRRTWEEIWADPAGHGTTGRELERLRATTFPFPAPGWRQKVASYRDEEISKSKVATDTKGNVTFTFTPSRTGYYVTKWTSEDRDGNRPPRARDLVTSETAVWVTEHATNEVGYHAAGLDLIVDEDTVRIGATMPVMIATPSSGRWVVLTTTADDIEQTQVVHLDGTVKLVQIPIDKRLAPNFFLTASSLFDRALLTDSKRIVVPPVEKFVKVDVQADRDSYEPRQKGTVTLTTRDAEGKPVSAEVSLAVADESVSAIREDDAGDPRPFFYGDLREANVQITASVMSQRYARLVENEKGALVDDRPETTLEERRATFEFGYSNGGWNVDGINVGDVTGGVVGGVAGGAVRLLPAFDVDFKAPRGVSESITVRAAARSWR